MFHGPSFIVSTMQEETTPIFKRLWYDWTQQQLGIEPTNPLGQCWVPPIVAFYDQQGLLRTYSLPGGSIRSPHPGSPQGVLQEELIDASVSVVTQVEIHALVDLRPLPTGPISRRPTPIVGRFYCRVGRFYHLFCNSRPTAPIKHV